MRCCRPGASQKVMTWAGYILGFPTDTPQTHRPRHRDHQARAADRHPRILLPDAAARLGGPQEPVSQAGADGPGHEQIRPGAQPRTGRRPGPARPPARGVQVDREVGVDEQVVREVHDPRDAVAEIGGSDGAGQRARRRVVDEQDLQFGTTRRRAAHVAVDEPDVHRRAVKALGVAVVEREDAWAAVVRAAPSSPPSRARSARLRRQLHLPRRGRGPRARSTVRPSASISASAICRLRPGFVVCAP